MILFFIYFGLSLLITGLPRSIMMDLTTIRFACTIGFVAGIIASLGDSVAYHPLQYELKWWLETADYVFGTILLMSLFILYQV